LRYLVKGRIDNQKEYNRPFQIILFSDVKRSDISFDTLYEDIYHQLKKEIESDERNLAFKYSHIESIEESSIK